VFKVEFVVAKEDGSWVKKASKTVPALPHTWPEKKK
jgi:hypothetical protein